MTRRYVILAALVLAATMLAGAPAPAQSDPVDVCTALPGVDTYGGGLAGTTPIILVHGLNGSSQRWSERISKSVDDDVEPLDWTFVDALRRFDDASVWVYDYRDTADKWVTDPTIGPGLADALDCFAEQGAEPSVIVGHSMGGLAARQAISLMEHPEAVAGVVTFGTPHLGSDVAAWLADKPDLGDLWPTLSQFPTAAPLLPLLRIAIEACEPHSQFADDFGFCSYIEPVHSEAGRALRTGSHDLYVLPPFPEGLPVLALAGQIDVVTQGSGLFFYFDAAHLEAGDLLVSEASAAASSTETPYVGRCQLNLKLGYSLSDDLQQQLDLNIDDGDEQALTMGNLLGNACNHSELTRGVELTNQALGFIGDIVEDQKPPPLITGVGIDRQKRLVAVVEGGIHLTSEPISFGPLGGTVAGGRDIDGDGSPEIFVDEQDTGSTVLRRVFTIRDEHVAQVGTMVFGGAVTEPAGAECIETSDGRIEVRSWWAGLSEEGWSLREIVWTINDGHQVEASRRDFTVTSGGDWEEDLATPQLAAFTTSGCEPTITFDDPFVFEWSVDGIAGLPWGSDLATAREFVSTRLGEPTWDYDNVDDYEQWCNRREIEVGWPGIRLYFDGDGRFVAVETDGIESREGLMPNMPVKELQTLFPSSEIGSDPLWGWPTWMYRTGESTVSGFLYPPNPDAGPQTVTGLRVSKPEFEANCAPVGG